MQRTFRAVAIVIGSLVALCALAVIGLNLYVQSVGAQGRIQQELSHRLGVPVKIRSISITPWSGLTVSGISIPDETRSTDFLTAQAFEMHPAMSSLLSGSLVIRKVLLVSPNVTWAQDEEGKWRLPGSSPPQPSRTPPISAAPAETPPTGRQEEIPPPAVPAGTPLSPVIVETPAPRPVNPPELVRRIVPDVRRAAIRDGIFRFLDRRGALVAAFEGVELQAAVEHGSFLQGVVHIDRLSAQDRFFLQQIRSPFKYTADGVELSRISARAAGGEINGTFGVQPQEENSPFRLNLHFRGLKADDVVSDAGGSRGMITGELDGSIDASAQTGSGSGLTGKGEIVLRNGQLQQYSLLVALGQVLQIEELTQLHLEEADAKYHLEEGQVKVDQLVLRSPNLRLSATGTVGLNGRLRLDAQLAINEKVRGQLFKSIRQNFQPTSDPQYSAVDFQVTGTLGRPRTNLVDRIVGHDLKDIVSGFLGGKKSGKSRKVPRAEVSPSPEDFPRPDASATPPSASPSP